MSETLEQSREHVARVIRTALQSEPEGRDLTGASRALADGRGSAGTLPENLRRESAGEPPLEIVRFDTDRIASFVFESSRPPVLSGASKILRLLNEGIALDYRDNVLFSAGGEGLLLLPRGQGAEVCRDIEKRFSSATDDALGVTTATLPLWPQELLAESSATEPALEGVRAVEGTLAVLSRLHDRIRVAKEGRLPHRAPVHGPSERCISCRDREAGPFTSPRKGSDGITPEGRLCGACKKRWDVGKKEIEGTSFEDLVKAFESASGETDRERGRSGYLGLLYADGNAMGKLFASLTSLTELRFASRAVTSIFHETRKRVESEVNASMPAQKGLLSLLEGGDEAIWILPAALSLRIASQLELWVETEAGRVSDFQAFLARHGVARLTFGAGLVLCGYSFPVRYQYEIASWLLKNAKSMFYGENRSKAVSSIDFEILTDSSPLSEDLKTTRSSIYQSEEPGFLRTCRPFTYQRFTQLLEQAGNALGAGLGKSQLYTLQDGASETKPVFLNALRYQLARKPAADRYESWLSSAILTDPKKIEDYFVHDLPGFDAPTSGTWVTDLLQLMPFLPPSRRERRA